MAQLPLDPNAVQNTALPPAQGTSSMQGQAQLGNTDHMYMAQQLAQQNGIDNNLFFEIQKKAENNTAMYEPTEAKNAIYSELQKYYQAEIQKKALMGQQLDSTNAWKQSIYDQYGQSGLVTEQGLFDRLQNTSNDRLNSMQQWLQQSSKSQIDAQEALLKQARDQQIYEIDKALQDAVNKGQLSIKEAEKQFEDARRDIYNKSYTNSQATNLMMADRGIGNSMQGVGLMIGDQNRTQSLLNQNLTTRDQQVNAINNQLSQLEQSASLDRAMANATFGNSLASATGQVNADMYNKMFESQMSEFQRLQNQRFELSMTERANAFDLQKMDKQQQQVLEQMAKQFGYDISKMDKQQQYTLAQMAEAFGYDMALQSSQQSFQASQNALDRDLQKDLQSMAQRHDFNMLNEEQRLAMDQYDKELQRKLALYTPGSDEYKLLNAEADWAYAQAVRESDLAFSKQIGATELASLLEAYPKKMPDPYDKKAVETYNSKVEQVNKQIQQILGTEGGKAYFRELAKSKGKTEKEANSWLDGVLKTISNQKLIVPGLTP